MGSTLSPSQASGPVLPDVAHPLSPDTSLGDAPEQPFPLERRYRTRVLPIIGLFVASLVALTALAVRQTVRDVHLEFAARRVSEIASEINRKAQPEWGALLAAHADGPQRQVIMALMMEAAIERGVPQLKVYIPSGEAVFSTDAAEIGTMEANAALTAAFKKGERVLLPHREADGTRYNEFYIPVERQGGDVALVFELYEPAGYLSGILLRALLLPTLVPGLLLVGLVVMLGYLIRRAQASIDLRAARVRELSARIESLLSLSAIGAMKQAPAGSDLPLKRIEVSLLYSDVRRFTEYSEAVSPEKVVAFLNRIMTIQIESIVRHGGDVDKLIGDALLARFDGPGKEERAIAAALDIQEIVEQGGLPRGIGVGVFTGLAILGPIGPEARRDYTVIGDSVNIAARLCAEAKRGEIVCDVATLDRSGAANGFASVENLQVKGREGHVSIRRMVKAVS
ncbi:adenylate/guanylate cyclase domain-containing protein [Rhizobium brockwellii]|uniref:adenylate/guanylate cyclase domain-containing protein n=1 Tax=Rhizobium TaxID=379 RepID=UPI001FE19B41|nr:MULTISPECIES: adenylate/guanylate cyclase domain-containing protein [Rhizobium]